MVLFQPLNEGSLTYAPLFQRTIAGAESNVAIGLRRLGKSARWISRLGRDPFGEAVYAALAGEGVDVSRVIWDETAPTAVFFKEFKGYGDPNVYYYRKHSAASRLSVDDVNEDWFAGARHLHVTGITPALGASAADATAHAMKVAKRLGLTVSFDPNLRRKLWGEKEARETLLSLIPLCDLFLPGAEEAEFLLGEAKPDLSARAFLDMGPAAVVIKLGVEGSIGFVGEEVIHVPAYKVEHTVDTVGAGDAFAAGLLSILADGRGKQAWAKAMPDALQRANLYGALATQFKGDWEGLPKLEEVQRLLQGRTSITR